MIVKTGFHGATLAVALVVTSGVMLAGDAVAQDTTVSQGEVTGRSATDSPSGTVASSPKSDLDQSGVRVETVIPVPRPTLTSTRSVIVPTILGSYR